LVEAGDRRYNPGGLLGEESMRGFGRSLCVALFAATPVLAQQAPAQPESTAAITPRSEVTAHDFMIATANPLATSAGRDVLAAGGSAADAAIAAQMVLNLVEPQSSGIGGGGFALYWDAATGGLASFDGRETAPAGATPDYWLGPDGAPMEFWDAVPGGRSVGVPGTLKLMETLHDRYGRLPWGELLAPAIALAEDGFPISRRLAAAIVEAQEHALADFPAARALYLHQDGSPKAEGEILRNPDLARTLRLVAAEGSDPLYQGAIARDIIFAVRTAKNPGMITLDDLASYEVLERPPVCMRYRAYEICGMGPPSSGALTVGQMLGMLSHFDLPGMGPGTEATHLFLEAGKLAFADRGLYMADSDFVTMPEGLLDPDYLKARAELIDPKKAMEAASPGEPPWKKAELRGPDGDRPNFGTTHFVIVDRYGDMLTATTTIETNFGSRVVTDGFMLNNELTDFAFAPEEDGKPVANRVEGGKRPRSSMAPTVVLKDGKPMLLIGSPGGANIIPFVAQALVGILDFGMDPQAAIDAPHALNRGGPTQVEDGPEAAAIMQALAARGQQPETADLNSGLQAIRIGDGLTGAADKRREGLVMGE
jgi:gamma-glutamyltranspeptidase / glutathione hydrolase